MRKYDVQYGDSLWQISKTQLGNPTKWDKIASINHITNPDLIYVGQDLELPDEALYFSDAFSMEDPSIFNLSTPNPQLAEKKATQIPGIAFTFFLAIQSDPYTGKLVRKVIFPKKVTDPELIARIINPKKYGFSPIDPKSNVSIARHVAKNMTNSKYISASEFPKGAPRFPGEPYWVDIQKLKRSGATIHDANAILKDLVRLQKKVKDPRLSEIIQYFKDVSRNVDKKVLIEGNVPPKAIKNALDMERSVKYAKGMGMGLKVLCGFSIVLTAYDLKAATIESIETKSIKPIATTSTHLFGGWAGAKIGARLGGMLGAAIGIETGPGAILTGAIDGAAGYFGAEWLTKYVEEKVEEQEGIKSYGQPQLAF